MQIAEIAVLAGDGIGQEVTPAAMLVLDRAAAECGFRLDWRPFPWSCETYVETGRMMPEDGLARLRQHDAIFLGAVGYPSVPDHVSLWGLLIPIRRSFDQYINLRPVRRLAGVQAPLRDELVDGVDFWIVRENSEGEYSQIGGIINEGRAGESVLQVASFSREGVDRVLRYAFEMARRLNLTKVDTATKSNGLYHSMPYWDARFDEIAAHYPDLKAEKHHVDILCARFVSQPRQFQIVVGSNLFGDILSDLGPAVTGSMPVAPSANINPERVYPSMFEPVHGSAPDIAGLGVANPSGQIWAGAMMLEHLGQTEAANLVERALFHTLEKGEVRTRDLGGVATTREMAEAVADAVTEVARRG